jgi:hypothetical protein
LKKGLGQDKVSHQFADAVFQSARILSRQGESVIKEQNERFSTVVPPSIELLFLTPDQTDGVGMTVLFHQSGPSVICYENPSAHSMSSKEISLPNPLQQICIGFRNSYTYFSLGHVEKKFKM